MHFSSILAIALGFAPAWAVPVQDLTGLDISPALLTPDKLLIDLPTGSLTTLKPKLPQLTGRIDFTLKKSINLNWNDGQYLNSPPR